VESYTWNGVVIQEGINCMLTVRLLEAADRNAPIIPGTDCKASSYSCNLHSGLLVWNDSIIHDCAMERVALMTMNVTENRELR
jgi:hypothetical protein